MCHFCEASQQLMEREEHLFGEADTFKHHEEEASKLAADYMRLKDLVQQTVMQSLTGSTAEALTSAVKAICQEDKRDELWKQRGHPWPVWRPCKWKELHISALSSLVMERMDNPSPLPAVKEAVQSSLQVDVNSMGKQLKDDMLLVVEDVKSCYPPEMDICNCYAKLYHKTFGTKLQRITDFGLDDKDCCFLLRWVNEYYPLILQNQQLATEIDMEALGRLLPAEILTLLEDQYLNTQQVELETYIGRVLEETEEKWKKGEEPKKEDGCFISTVAQDIVQITNGMVTSAEIVVLELDKAKRITSKLHVLMQRFSTFQDNVIKQDRANSKAIVKANLHCINQFEDFLFKRSQLFPEPVQKKCLSILAHMRESAHEYLLRNVHALLKPRYRRLGTKEWLYTTQFNKLLCCIERQIQNIEGLPEICHQGLVGQFHVDVAAEYVKRLLKAQVKLNDKEEQDRAYTVMTNNTESLHNLMSKMGSKEDWLKEVLTMIAEVLKLQDLPAIQIHMAALGNRFPDLGPRHVSALLKLKATVSKKDRRHVRQTLSEVFRGGRFGDAPPFFSKVKVY